ncbi:MAG TPA: hypothetical protein VNH63_11625 [Gemmatimonadales bacterium]|nr:hypothetical protein [Gemmatimonadales bacterium]
MLLVAACTRDLGPTGSPPARLDYVDGAIEPILARGATIAIQGYGFGATQGTGAVHFARLGGGEVAAVVADTTAWSNAAIRVAVPDSAVTGALSVTTATGGRLTATVHIVPRVAFAATGLDWQHRTAAGFPQAPVGVALAAAEFPSGTALAITLFAAGGAEPVVNGADTSLAPDSGIYVAHAQPGGDVGAWVHQTDVADPIKSHVLPAPRAFAAAAVATPYNSRFTGIALYVLGGIDAAGVPQSTVFAADVSRDSVVSRFIPVEALPAPVAGAIAVVRRGRVYVIGGTDSAGRPRQTVFIGRIDPTGHIDGWYTAPALPGPRAYGGGIVLDDRVVAFGGVSDSVPPGGGLGTSPTRLATSDTAPASLVSGFVTGAWAPGAALLPDGRSQFATLDVGNAVLLVGGMYSGAAGNTAETLAADVVGDSLGPFTTAATASTIWGQGGGTLVGPAGVTWRDADGTRHGIVLGGMDLATRLRTAGVWGF